MKVDVVDSLLAPAGAKVRSPLEASFPRDDTSGMDVGCQKYHPLSLLMTNTKTWCLIGCWLGLVEINLSISALKVFESSSR
jgi:hypothetical protein